MTNLTFLVNKTSTDDTLENHPENFEAVADDDVLLFSAGSAAVADGQPAPPTTPHLNQAATLLDPINPTVVAHYLLEDMSAYLLKEIFLAGKVNKQYVFCASFDGPTASEPILEAWDDVDMDTIALLTLGANTPGNSWYNAICTTVTPPGASWSRPLAGDGSPNSVLLNGGMGPLDTPGTGLTNDLYFNFYVEIPGGIIEASTANPILAIIYTTN